MTASLPPRAVLSNRNLLLLLSGRFLSCAGVQIQMVAVGWLIYELTDDPLALGLVGLITILPAIALILVTGHVIDRFDRRRILMLCYATTALAAAGLLACALAGRPPVWLLYALLLIFGVTRAFANPATQSLVPNLVPTAEIGPAVAWSSTVYQTANLAGPAIAGGLYLIGEPAVFAAAVICFVLAGSFYAAIRHRSAAPPRERASWQSLLAGVAFIRSRPVIFGAISLDLFAVLLGGATALLPIFARDILHVGPSGLGLLRSMPAVGAVAMALYLAWRPLQRRVGRRMLQAVAVFGIATIVFGLSTNFLLSLCCLLVLGAADMISVVIRHTLVQVETPDHMRGRVATVNTVFIGTSNELGEFESGVMAALLGTVVSVVAGGVGTLLVVLFWARWFPELRARERLVQDNVPVGLAE